MTAIRKEDIVKLQDAVIETILPTLVGRQVIPTVKVDPAIQVYAYDKWNHMSAAQLIAKGGTFPRDEVSMARASVAMQKIGKGFLVFHEDQLASQNVMTNNGKSAARQLAEAEDDFIFNGCTLPAVNGIIAGAGNTTSAAAVWSSAIGTKKPYDDVLTAVSLMEEDGFHGPYVMVVERVNLKEIMVQNIQAGASGTPYTQEILDSGLIAKIVMSTTVPHGTAIIHQSGEENAAWVVAEDISVKEYPETENQVIPVNVFERGAPVIRQPNSICTITSC